MRDERSGAAGEAFPGKFGGLKPENSTQGGAGKLLSGVYFPFKITKFMLHFLAFIFSSCCVFYLFDFFLTENLF